VLRNAGSRQVLFKLEMFVLQAGSAGEQRRRANVLTFTPGKLAVTAITKIRFGVLIGSLSSPRAKVKAFLC